jgi:hypothetical protein
MAIKKLEILSGIKVLPQREGAYEALTPRRSHNNQVWLVWEDRRYWNFRQKMGVDLNGLTPHQGRLLALASGIGVKW